MIREGRANVNLACKVNKVKGESEWHQQVCCVCAGACTEPRALTLEVVHREDTGMIESCFADALIGPKHESQAFDWHTLKRRTYNKINQSVAHTKAHTYLLLQMYQSQHIFYK